MYKIKLRKGIAMIELIFAIVVMGIVLMSAPMLISTSTKSGYVALQQESIAALASEIGMILTYPWDEGDVNETLSSPILIAGGHADLNEVLDADGNGTGFRVGTPTSSHRTFLTSLGGNTTVGGRLNAVTTFSDAGETVHDDIDDFDGTSASLSNIDTTTTAEGDYIDKAISISRTVSYISDTPTGAGTYNSNGTSLNLTDPFGNTASNPTNIKMVRVTLTTTTEELNKTITLRAFSCNIGAYQLEEKVFP